MENPKSILISNISKILSNNSNELDYRKIELTKNIKDYLIYTKEKDNLTSSIKDILSKKKSDGSDGIDSDSVTPPVSDYEDSKKLSRIIQNKCNFTDDVSISINTYLLRKKKIDECNSDILNKLETFNSEAEKDVSVKKKKEIKKIIDENHDIKKITKLNKFMKSITKDNKYLKNNFFKEIVVKYRTVHDINDEIYDSVKKINETQFYRDSTRDSYCNKIKHKKKETDERTKTKEVRKALNIEKTPRLNEYKTNNYIPSDTCINTNIIKNTISITITSNNLHKENITQRILNGLNQLSFIKQIN